MPSVRFSRDKRGYEYVYLVHTPTRRGKPGRSRVLYWYRTPPGVRIGRKPFDEEVQRTIEKQNPGVSFDWDAIINTPMPPPDMTEYWRERRKAEKAARQERRAMEAGDSGDEAESVTSEVLALPEPLPSDADPAASPAELTTPQVEGQEPAAGQPGKRRRRRGGRRRRTPEGDPRPPDSAAAVGAEAELPGTDGPDGDQGQSGKADPASEEE